jgi:hypothetical protein
MDAGFEYTMLKVDGLGKFVVAVGDRWTTSYFASRDVVVAGACSRSAAPATTGRPTAATRAECQPARCKRERRGRRTSVRSAVAELEAIGVVSGARARARSRM